jgi:hypothetical protein
MEPPLVALYQSIVHPLGAVALNVTVPLPQRELALGLVGAVGAAVTVAVTANRDDDTHWVVVLRDCA